jgi:hypothetical protein
LSYHNGFERAQQGAPRKWRWIIIDVTVKVPEDRVGEFYSMFGAWLTGSQPVAPTLDTATSEGRPAWSSADADLAAVVWDKLSDTARRLFSTLIDSPDERFSGDELARILRIEKGRLAIAGLLTWPGRYCRDVNRTYAWSFDYPDGELVEYWFTAENAALFREARDAQD